MEQGVPCTSICIVHSLGHNVVTTNRGGHRHPIVFASRELTTFENNYTTTEREGLEMVYALQKFRHYLLGSHFKMYTYYYALKYLVNTPVLGGRICRWLVLFQEYDFEVVVKPGKLNAGLDHLSCILIGEDASNLDDNFPYPRLFAVRVVDDYFVNIVAYLSTSMAPFEMTVAQKKWVVVKETNLYKLGEDGIMRCCVLEREKLIIIGEAYDGIVGGHYAGKETAQKILCAGIWWPTLHKYVKEYCQSCDVFQRVGKPSRRD